MLVYRVGSIAASLLIVWGTAVSIADAQDSTCTTCETQASTCEPGCQDSKCRSCLSGCKRGRKLCRLCDRGDECDGIDCHHTKYGLPYWMVPDWCKDEDQIPGVKRWSKQDYYLRGQLPIGQRQKCYKGKIWPVDPRPTGPTPHTIHRFHAAHYWPHPYDIWSRNRVKAVIAAHEQNGWRDATTIYDYHFNPETNELTDSGVLHLQSMLMHTPGRFRTLYLQTSAEEGVNDMRMVAVKEVASRLTPGEEIPDVVYRNVMSVGRPAQEVDNIRRAVLSKQPAPVIPGSFGGSGGGGYGANPN